MRATIQTVDRNNGQRIHIARYEREEAAHDAFDAMTQTWHEWDDPNRQNENPYRYAMDLIAHHPDGNDHCRRTMYTN